MHTAIGTASALQAGIAARGYDAISMALFGRAAAQDKRGVVHDDPQHGHPPLVT